MRRLALQLFMALQVVAWAGCAATTVPPPPKIEGQVGSVSKSDIQQAIRLVEDDMRHDFWIVYAIDRVEVHNHNEIVVVYSRGNYVHSITVQRVHGLWTVDKRVQVVVNVPRSNQSLQPTAGRFAALSESMKGHPFQSLLAPASGG
jgi:hypothetical protein